MTFTLYARREPAIDSDLRKYAPEARRTDVVFYRDAACTKFYCRWAWDKSPPTRRRQTVVLNCFRWKLVWVEEKKEVRKAA